MARSFVLDVASAGRSGMASIVSMTIGTPACFSTRVNSAWAFRTAWAENIPARSRTSAASETVAARAIAAASRGAAVRRRVRSMGLSSFPARPGSRASSSVAGSS